jgi:hypothetical protein
MDSEKWHLRATQHIDEQGQFVQPNTLLVLDVRVSGNDRLVLNRWL